MDDFASFEYKLEEAIADAKAVRQTALANAKAALEEAFSPSPNGYYTKACWEMTCGKTHNRCQYCNSKYKEDNFKCKNCGAPL